MNKDEINRLKGSLRIEEVAGRYMSLMRKGRLWTGLCPFHGDRHPSFAIDPEKQTFMCYACGAKGDVLEFVRKMKNCSFKEVLGMLIEKVEPSVTPSPREREREVCKAACQTECKMAPPLTDFLHLLQPCASGHSELSGTWIDFEVGHSPFLVPPEWKAMRGRLVFPIRDEEGNLVGFAARRLSDTDAGSPKYINSAASELYHKSELLYGLYRAKDSIRREGYVFVVEGYKDVLAMHAAGLTNTVALCGTALCPGHIALLKKYAGWVYLLLDSDPAGVQAAARAAFQLREADMEVEVCRLPEGEDPDSLFRKQGKAAFRSSLEAICREVAPSGEVLLLRRIRRGIMLLSLQPDLPERGRLLSLLTSCMDSLTAMSHEADRPATLDWRWV